MANIHESTLTVVKLTAAEGYYLTQNTLQDGEQRVFTKVAFLAQEQPAEYWREATEHERQEFLNTAKEENDRQ